MKPIFTIHAGEYLVGSEIEKKFKEVRVWVPSKDTGIDLLVTNKQCNKTVSVQVKFSKDFSLNWKPKQRVSLSSAGWWTLNTEKLKNSPADIWVLVTYGFRGEDINYIIIDPKVLYEKLVKLGRSGEKINTYFVVTSKNMCWENRGLKEFERQQIVEKTYISRDRDFTKHLGSWENLLKYLQ